jgi:hypothetical protein
MSEKTYTELETCKREIWTLRIAGISVIFAFLALIVYKSAVNIDVFSKDTMVNDSLIVFVAIGIIALIFMTIGLILSIRRKSLTGLFLSLIIPIGLIIFRNEIPTVNLTDITTFTITKTIEENSTKEIEVTEKAETADGNSTNKENMVKEALPIEKTQEETNTSI